MDRLDCLARATTAAEVHEICIGGEQVTKCRHFLPVPGSLALLGRFAFATCKGGHRVIRAG
jgi:hypothetical protein